MAKAGASPQTVLPTVDTINVTAGDKVLHCVKVSETTGLSRWKVTVPVGRVEELLADPALGNGSRWLSANIAATLGAQKITVSVPVQFGG